MNESELRSLVALLDDDDPEVFQHIEDKLLSYGTGVIPFLEEEWGELKDMIHQQRLENIIHQLQFNELFNSFQTWFKTPDQDLLEGVYLICKYRFPEYDKQNLINTIERLRLDVWLEMNYELSPYEKVRIINYILYQVHGFKGNVDNYHDPSNSFINQVLESKKGNPILLATIYILVAQKLNIPIYGVNLPQHFVLAYMEEFGKSNVEMRFNDIEKLLNQNGKILFYINAFNGGTIFSKSNLEQFLQQIKVESRQAFLDPCSNLDIIKRILRNLASSYEKLGKPHKQNEILKILYALGEPPLADFHELGSDPE
ncbi:MAG: transglutaminase-like domain-containing protein [Bacteroidia bacterium]|nr:transglutaminase-like domain-containing protein [Bacteroidia bacterium]MCF8447116.1 transglutaminase-like domain-containing protein [Bacteroidia bacterium]